LIGFFEQFLLSALLIALSMALGAWMLARRGVEARGAGLEAIQRQIRAR
jgi:putative MFS transporter